MKRLIVELNNNEMANAGFLMSSVFGDELPKYMIRGDGRDQSMRNSDQEQDEAQLDKFHIFFKNHQQKLKDRIHFEIGRSQGGHRSLVISTTIASCFALFRERIIRHWPLDHVPFNH